jgi:hypothetical protein
LINSSVTLEAGMLGLESSVKWRGTTRFEQRRLRCRESTPGAYRGRAATGRIAVTGIACPAQARLSASGAEPWRTARPCEPGTTMAVHGWWPGPRGSGAVAPAVAPATSRACSRRERDRLVNRPDLARQRAPVGWSDADLICGQGTVAEDAAGPRPYPAGPTGGRVRWVRNAAPAWPCPPAWWVGRSLATRPRR